MSAKPTAQQCHALTTYFISQCKDRLGKVIKVNRNKTRWGFESLLMDHSPTEARELIDFYLLHYENPTIEWFLFNYEKVDENRETRGRQESSRKAQREETQRRLEEWRVHWNQ